ncbi:MAG TPA: DUF1259 domain-containing protein [Candidatus Manganitrophaceae bacterium]|nr:DUF1259 domain-containing protein [Candidatus Manganitrophaceae bacterium]
MTSLKRASRPKTNPFLWGSMGLILFASLIGISFLGAEPPAPPPGTPLDRKKIEAVFDRPGEMNNDVLKISFPRTDLKVTLEGVQLKPGFALGTWAAFKPVGNEAIALGDIVLKEEEIKQVESKLKEKGIEITAIHNHLIGEKPKVIYMHFLGKGNAEQLAADLKEALQLTATPLKAPQSPGKGAAGADETAEAKKIDAILGKEGKVKNGVIQYGVPRKESIMLNGVEIPPFMGVATAMNFQPGKEKTVTTGDFVLIDKEVQPVTQALRQSGIEVTALHNHLIGEEPRLFFLHFWGVGPSEKLAEALKKALDQVTPPAS